GGVPDQRGGDVGPVHAGQDGPGGPAGDGGHQVGDVDALELATGDPHHPGVGGQRGQGGVRVGGFAVVDVRDAGDGDDVGVAVRFGLVGGQAVADRLGGHTVGPGQGGGGQGVGDVVRTGRPDPRRRRERHPGPVPAGTDAAGGTAPAATGAVPTVAAGTKGAGVGVEGAVDEHAVGDAELAGGRGAEGEADRAARYAGQGLGDLWIV